MDALSFVLVLAALVVSGLDVILLHRKIDDLNDRLGAKDLEQYKYYKTKFPKDVAELEKVREEARVVREEEREEEKTEKREEKAQDLSQFEGKDLWEE